MPSVTTHTLLCLQWTMRISICTNKSVLFCMWTVAARSVCLGSINFFPITRIRIQQNRTWWDYNSGVVNDAFRWCSKLRVTQFRPPVNTVMISCAYSRIYHISNKKNILDSKNNRDTGLPTQWHLLQGFLFIKVTRSYNYHIFTNSLVT